MRVFQTTFCYLELHAVPDSTISGRLEFADDAVKEIFEKWRPKPEIELTLLGAAGQNNPARADDIGAFRLEKLQAGVYWAGISDERMYVKSMQLGTQAIDGAVLDFNEGSHGADLTLVLAAATGSVSGTPTGGTMILKFAAHDRHTGVRSAIRECERGWDLHDSESATGQLSDHRRE